MVTKNQISKNALISMQQLAAIFNSVPHGITVERKSGTIMYANETVSDILGYSSPEELLKVNIKKAFAKFNITDKAGKSVSVKAMPASKVRKDGLTFTQVYKFKDKRNNNEKWVEIKATALNHNISKDQVVLKTFEDVTEQIEEQRQRELFLGIVSHEFKNPLASIKAFSDLIKRRLASHNYTDTENYIYNIDSQIERLLTLINDLSDVTRIRAKLLKLNVCEFDYDELVNKIITNFQPVAVDHIIKRKGLAKVKVWADKDRISQVLINLLSNAVKYSAKDKKIIVFTKINGNQIITGVKDYGIGIPPKNQNELFHLYKRIENPSTNHKPGLGMGLYICSAIIRSHQGKIWVKSKPGKGSIFYFSLPLDE